MFCPNCGKEMKDGAVFCSNCGYESIILIDIKEYKIISENLITQINYNCYK